MPDLPAPLPALPGATWRPLTLDDVPAYVRLMEAARVADGDEEVQTEEVVRHEFDDPQMPVATNSTGLFGADGALLGYAVVMERLAGEGARRAFIWGRTDPAVRGRGIGSAALAWAVARADEILATQPADVPRFTDAFTDVRRTDAVALFEEHGFAPVRWYFTMRRVFDTAAAGAGRHGGDPDPPLRGGRAGRPRRAGPPGPQRVVRRPLGLRAGAGGRLEPQLRRRPVLPARPLAGRAGRRRDRRLLHQLRGRGGLGGNGHPGGLGRPARRAAGMAPPRPRDGAPGPLDGDLRRRRPGGRNPRRGCREPDGRGRNL